MNSIKTNDTSITNLIDEEHEFYIVCENKQYEEYLKGGSYCE